MLKSKPELNIGDNKEYKIKTISKNKIYAKKTVGQLSRLYYLIFSKNYIEEESIWESVLAIICLYKIISIFYNNYSEKPILISLSIDLVLPMIKLTIKLIAKPLSITKKKQSWQVKDSIK